MDSAGDVHAQTSGARGSAELATAAILLDRATRLVIALDERLEIVASGEATAPLNGHRPGRPLASVFPSAPDLVAAAYRALDGESSQVQVLFEGRHFLADVIPAHGSEVSHGLGAPRVLVALLGLESIAEELQLLEAERGIIFAQLPAIVWSTDRSLRVTRVSGSLLATLQLPRPPWGARVDEVVDDPVAARVVLEHHRTVLEGERQRFHLTTGQQTFDVHLAPLSWDGEIRGCVGCAVEITGWLAREQRLSDSNRILSQTQLLAHVGFFDWDVAADRLSWSPELLRMYGLTLHGLEGSSKDFLARQHPADLEATRAAMERAQATGGAVEVEHRIVRPTGEVRKVLSRLEAERGAGRPVRLLGVCFDITDRWRAELERERSLSLLRATLDSTADGILVVDRASRVTLFNERFRALWRIPDLPRADVTDQELLGQVLPQLHDPEGFVRRVRELYDRPAEESHEVLRFRDGRVYERLSRPQRLGEEIVGRVWSFRDVTAHERLLRRAMFLADATRLLGSLEAEQAAEAVAHLALPLLGEACALDLVEDEHVRRQFAVGIPASPRGFGAAAPVRPPPPGAISGKRVVAEERGVCCLSLPLRTRDAILGVLTFRSAPGHRYGRDEVDLAEELARRMSLSFDNARLFRHAREALRIRDEFLSVAAHELRGPATALKLVLHGLQKEQVPPDQAARMLELANRQVKHISRFVDELLDVTRLRSEQMHVELEQLDLVDVVREVTSRMEDEIAHSGSHLELHADGPVAGRWDRLRLEQLVTNLLGNALKFGAGRPVELAVRADEADAVLEVTDHGIGIPPGQREQIFQAFERAVSSRHYGGLGLGLYISRRIAEALGGTLRVASEPGEGSTFTVRLPRIRSGT